MPVYADGIFQPQPWLWPVPGGDDGAEIVKLDNPIRYLTPAYKIVSGMAADWERGLLPLPGGVLDQPARLVAAIRLRAEAVAHCRDILARQHASQGVPQ